MRGLINFKQVTCAYSSKWIYLAVNLVAFNFCTRFAKGKAEKQITSTDLTLSYKSLNGYQNTCKSLQIIML